MPRSGLSSQPLLALALILVLASCTSAGQEVDPAGPQTDPAEPVATGEASTPADGGGIEPVTREPFAVPRELFGTHVKGLAAGGQPLPPQAGSIRLWDSGVAWRLLEPEPGDINWAALDRAVEQAERTGASDITWVHGSTPAWAALDPDAPGLYGPGTSSAPEAEAYLGILRKVAERYRGRITSYQVWNEANIKIFYRGKPDYLAELTLKAKEVLDEVDPDAALVGASTTFRRNGPVKSWYEKYAAGLAERDWPVDAMAVHLYPLADEGAEARADYIRLLRPWLAERGWTGPVWDTEVNYGDRRDFAKEIVVVPQRRAAAWVARTYIDSLALGIDRVHWYAWNDHILGVDQVDAESGDTLPAGRAYLVIQEWLQEATWQGCEGELMQPTGEDSAMTSCALAWPDGRSGQILFSHGGKVSVPTPPGTDVICQLDGSCEEATGATVPIGIVPVLVRGT